MPTIKPRVSVTLEPEMYELLRDLAGLNGESVSAVVSGLLDAVAPTVRRVVVAGRQFQALSDEMKAKVGQSFVDADAAISPAVADLQAQAFAVLATLEQAAPSPAPDPRPVTRGSRPPLKSVGPRKSGRSR